MDRRITPIWNPAWETGFQEIDAILRSGEGWDLPPGWGS